MDDENIVLLRAERDALASTLLKLHAECIAAVKDRDEMKQRLIVAEGCYEGQSDQVADLQEAVYNLVKERDELKKKLGKGEG